MTDEEYPTEEDALWVLEYLHPDLIAFQCRHCEGWHVGHPRTRRKKPCQVRKAARRRLAQLAARGEQPPCG